VDLPSDLSEVSLAAGWLSDLLARRGTSPVRTRKVPVIVAMIGMALFMAQLAPALGLWPLLQRRPTVSGSTFNWWRRHRPFEDPKVEPLIKAFLRHYLLAGRKDLFTGADSTESEGHRRFCPKLYALDQFQEVRSIFGHFVQRSVAPDRAGRFQPGASWNSFHRK